MNPALIITKAWHTKDNIIRDHALKERQVFTQAEKTNRQKDKHMVKQMKYGEKHACMASRTEKQGETHTESRTDRQTDKIRDRKKDVKSNMKAYSVGQSMRP